MAGVDWDEELPENLKVKWEKWVSELPQLSNVAIPRCLRGAYPENIELHLLSDAFNEAFASVASLVCRYQDSSPSLHLIASVSCVPSEGNDNSPARAYGCCPFKSTSPEYPESDLGGQNHLLD